jgi:hypothetical protein
LQIRLSSASERSNANTRPQSSYSIFSHSPGGSRPPSCAGRVASSRIEKHIHSDLQKTVRPHSSQSLLSLPSEKDRFEWLGAVDKGTTRRVRPFTSVGRSKKELRVDENSGGQWEEGKAIRIRPSTAPPRKTSSEGGRSRDTAWDDTSIADILDIDDEDQQQNLDTAQYRSVFNESSLTATRSPNR